MVITLGLIYLIMEIMGNNIYILSNHDNKEVLIFNSEFEALEYGNETSDFPFKIISLM